MPCHARNVTEITIITKGFPTDPPRVYILNMEFVCNTGATFSIQPTYVGRILSLAFILNLYLIGQAYDVSAHEIVHIVMNVVLVFSLIIFIHLFLIQAGLHVRICEIFYIMK